MTVYHSLYLAFQNSVITPYPTPPYAVYNIPNAGAFFTSWYNLGGVQGALGDPTNNWYLVSNGEAQNFQHGGIYWSSATGTQEVQGAIYQEYTGVLGGPTSTQGFPTTNEQGIANGRVSYFYGNLCGTRGPNNSGSAIYYSSSTGAHLVGGCIYNKYWNQNGPNSLQGFPTSDVLVIPGGYVSYFAGNPCGGGSPPGPYNSNSAIYSSGYGTYVIGGCIYAKYVQPPINGPTGNQGYPTSDVMAISGGYVAYFAGNGCGAAGPYNSGNAIYASSYGTYLVGGCIYYKYWHDRSGPAGTQGFPTSDVLVIPGGYVSYFAGNGCGSGPSGPNNSNSAIYSSGYGTYFVGGCIYQKYIQRSGPAGTQSYPTSDVMAISGGYVAYFAGNGCGSGPSGPYNSKSAIYSSGYGTYFVGGCIYQKYAQLNGTSSLLGYPTSDVMAISGGYVAYFAGDGCGAVGPYNSSSAIYSSPAGTYAVQGCIYHQYAQLNGSSSCLGFPTSDQFSTNGTSGDQESLFQHGSIIWSASTGALTVTCQ